MAEIEVHYAAGAQDLDAVRELMRAYRQHLAGNPSGASGICIGGFEQELAGLPGAYAEPFGVLLLAKVDGSTAGCVAVRPASMVTTETACEMKRLWVGEGYRGLGLGKRLAEEALRWAQTAGYRAMYLDTVPAAMPEANALYERLGFIRVARYNDNDVADVVFYRLPLSALGC